MQKIWKNTETIDNYINWSEYNLTQDKSEATVALIGGKTINPDEFPNLKLLFRTGISKADLPFDAASKKGFRIELPSDRIANIIYEETADFTCYLLIRMLYQNIGTTEPWRKEPRIALHAKKLLVLGTGNIGRRVVEKMKVFLTVLTYDSMIDKPENLNEKLGQVDAISIHIPATTENIDFIDATKMKKMKDGCVIVNTARGQIVNEQALYDELKEKRLRAAFDVFWKEPYTGILSELSDEYFFMTPHTASTSDDFLIGTAKEFIDLVKGIENA